MMMMHSGMNMMHGVRSMNAQQHSNLAQTNGSATTKQQQRQQQAHIRKPMNAFMLWSQAQRHKVAAEHPEMHHSEISKRLGAEWKLLTADEQKLFFDEAKLLQEQHKRDHPDYRRKYRRKPKPSMKLTEPVMPCAPSIFQPGTDARAFTPNPPSYDIGNSSNVDSNHVVQYGMHFATHPARYSGDPQGGANQQLSVTSGQHQGIHKIIPPSSIATPLPPNLQPFNSYKSGMANSGVSHYGMAYCTSPYGAQIYSPTAPESPVQGPVMFQPVLENVNCPGVHPPFMQSMYRIHTD